MKPNLTSFLLNPLFWNTLSSGHMSFISTASLLLFNSWCYIVGALIIVIVSVMHIVQMDSTHQYFKWMPLGKPLGVGKASGFQGHVHSKDMVGGNEPPIAKIPLTPIRGRVLLQEECTLIYGNNQGSKSITPWIVFSFLICQMNAHSPIQLVLHIFEAAKSWF